MRPRFSVVIPVHDRAEVVGRAVASVVAQTFADLEVVVVDDGSTDDSVAAARAVADERVRIVRQEHAGTSAARASGMRRARGAWVVFLDPDDELAPGLLARFGRLIDSTDAGLVSCAGDQVYADGTRTRFEPMPIELPPGAVLDLTWHGPADGDLARGTDRRPPVRACVRPGAFATTRELLRRAGAFTDVEDHEPIPPVRPEHHVLSSTIHSAGTGCLDLDDADHSCLDPETFDPDAFDPAMFDREAFDPGARDAHPPVDPPSPSGAAVAQPSVGPVVPISPDVRLPSHAAHVLGADADLAEAAQRVVTMVLEDGLSVVHTPEPLVCWNEPAPDASAAGGDELRLTWSLQAIDAIARTPIPDGQMLARYATIGGVAAARLRDHRESRRLFRLARRAIPDVPKHWVRWLVSCVPPAADRIWEPTPAVAAPSAHDGSTDSSQDDVAHDSRLSGSVLAG